VLVVSSGTNADLIAAEIIRQLPATLKGEAYPITGDGRGFEGVCPVVGPRRGADRPASGSSFGKVLAAFGMGAARRFLRHDAKSYANIVVVGDASAMLLCWLSRVKARVYLELGNSSAPPSFAERLPLRTAKLVLTSDAQRADVLKAAGINARFAGNAVMDTLVTGAYDASARRRSAKALAILPAPRPALVDDFRTQLEALRRVPGIEGMDVFCVLARGGDAEDLRAATGLRLSRSAGLDGDHGVLSDGRVAIQLSSGSPGAVIAASEVVLGQAEVASLQAAGMGKPVVTFAYGGDTTLAGDGILTVARDPVTLAAALSRLLYDDEDRIRRGTAGRERVGPPGAIPAIIAELNA
jgi:uncharacterized protein (TIGR03492 family)